MDDADRETIETILHYWFGELHGPHDVDPSKNALWWGGSEAIDAEIRERFGELVERACAGRLDHWAESPRGAVALVILLDQFTRNVGRGTPDAFRGDAHARRITEQSLARGFAEALRPIEHGFLCMPLMHAEDPAAAERSVAVFSELSQRVATLGLQGYPEFQPSAVQHAEIVRRFGRYPHRNAILGRPSTEQEEAFLAAGGPSFGQRAKG